MQELEAIDRASLARFLVRWYGHEAGALSMAGDTIPPPLDDWYQTTGSRMREFSRYYNFRSRDSLIPSGDGLIVFCSGPLEDPYSWAYQPGDESPPTFEISESGSVSPTGLLLHELILYIAVSSAVFAPDIGLANMASGRSNYDRVLDKIEPLEGDLWGWPDSNVRFYQSDGVLAQAGHTGGDHGYQILLAADSEEQLEAFNDLEWEWDSRL